MMRALTIKTLFVLSILLSAQALAFDVEGLSYTILNGTDVEVTGRVVGNTDTDIVIPATVSDVGTTYSVTSVGGVAFYRNPYTGSVFPALISVTIPNSVTNIGNSAFYNNALTSVTIPDSVTIIRVNSFGFNALTSVIIPDSVTTIGDGAFYQNALTSVIIPDSVTFLSGFAGNALTNVIIPDSVTTIGDGAFGSNSLTSVIIPDSVTTIGDAAFRSNALTSIIIPDSVTTIGDTAFGSNALISITIPDSVTTIGAFAFQSNALTNVIIPDSVTTIGDAAFRSNALTSIIIPDSVTTIGNSAFFGNALTSLTIGNSVTTIGGFAFYGSALTSVIIPDSVTTIGAFAFFVNALNSVAFKGDFGDFQLNMFENNPNLATITYCDVTTGWPQGFSNGSTIIVTTPIACSPPLAPDAPEFTGIITSNGQASVSLSVADDGGSPITEYTVLCVNANLLGFGNTSPTSPITISGLTNGETYACRATATNDVGTSPVSEASAPFTLATPPTMPQITGIVPGNGQASISVSVADDGGSPITSYTALCGSGGTDFFSTESATLPITVSGLVNGLTYLCLVSAANNVGMSIASELSAPFIPVAPAPGC